MNSLILLILALIAGLAFVEKGHAQEPASSAARVDAAAQINKASLKEALENKKFQDTKEITDPRLRAEKGSLSRYSLKFDLSYYGPTVGEPLAKDQPNPDKMVGSTETTLKGAMGLALRLDPESSVGVGTGLNVIYPFHGAKRTDVSTPYLRYDLFKRFGGLQVRQSLALTATTDPYRRAVGNTGAVSYATGLVHDIGTSGYAVGMDAFALYNGYSRDYVTTDGQAMSYLLGLSPVVKYNFSDKTSVVNNLTFKFWNPRSRDNATVLMPQTLEDRLGVGYAFSKDVYLQPFVKFYPGKMAWDTTTINFTSIFSIL